MPSTAMASVLAVENFHVLGVTAAPEEAKAPPIVDPNGMLALAVALERFKSADGVRGKFSTATAGAGVLPIPPL